MDVCSGAREPGPSSAVTQRPEPPGLAETRQRPGTPGPAFHSKHLHDRGRTHPQPLTGLPAPPLAPGRPRGILGILGASLSLPAGPAQLSRWAGARFYFYASVPQIPLLAQRSVASSGDFDGEAPSARTHL